jgi:di/tripeptidase
VAAPPATRGAVETLLPRLEGDFSFLTLADQAAAESGVRAVVQHLRAGLDAAVLATHPADEPAVAAYFEYAHALTVLGRLERLGREMHALFELIHGAPPTPVDAHTYLFPD